MKNLFKALADFQQEVPVIHKGTKGYGYSYADLPTIFEAINPLLKKHGLGFTQLMGDNNIKTIIFHDSGESIETTTTIPENVVLKGMNAFQVLGSAITYIRRYALSSALGLVTDKDTDAGGEQVKPKQNTVTVPNDVLLSISKQLEKVQNLDELKDLHAKEVSSANRYPQVKGMFTAKKIALNGN